MPISAVSIAIPTLDRGSILVDTLDILLARAEAEEVLVVDQTASHPPRIAAKLKLLDKEGRIRWIRLERPSIPHAMNVALEAASQDIVLFLDDDIVPSEALASRHFANYADKDVVAVAGQVIQPWQSPADIPRPKRRSGIWEDLDFPFHSTRRATVRSGMAGNLSVRRDAALAAGGFDENFIGAAYRFETEFCRRLTRLHGKIVFDPEASVHHLKAKAGGIRVYGDGVRGSRIEHSVGNYYFAFSESSGLEFLSYLFHSITSTTLSKYYACRPWEIPGHILYQISSIKMARKLYIKKKM